jgi:hypothetical protein
LFLYGRVVPATAAPKRKPRKTDSEPRSLPRFQVADELLEIGTAAEGDERNAALEVPDVPVAEVDGFMEMVHRLLGIGCGERPALGIGMLRILLGQWYAVAEIASGQFGIGGAIRLDLSHPAGRVGHGRMVFLG